MNTIMVFITKENPSLVFTTVVEHTIHIKPDAVSKHQKPYRLSPDERKVLRTQLTLTARYYNIRR